MNLSFQLSVAISVPSVKTPGAVCVKVLKDVHTEDTEEFTEEHREGY